MRFKIFWISLIIIIVFSFPSICFSEMKTVQGIYCDVYLGDLKNKKELDMARNTVRNNSIKNGLYQLTKPSEGHFSDKCISYVINNFLGKIVVVSHMEKGKKICDTVKITLDPEVIEKYLSHINCQEYDIFDEFLSIIHEWDDIDNVLTKKSEKINIGLIIETQIPNIEASKRELLENKEENEFYSMTESNKDKYKVIERRHLSKVLEEQKRSSSGITDRDTFKLGKLPNLDIIVLRLIYGNSRATKVLKVDTGEVLLFRTYETKATKTTMTMKTTKAEEGWVYYGTSRFGDCYYDESSITNVGPKMFRVWEKVIFSKSVIKIRKKYNLSTDNRIQLAELDCVNNTEKKIKYVKYNNEGNILGNYDYSNPQIEQVFPDAISWLLLRKVCK